MLSLCAYLWYLFDWLIGHWFLVHKPQSSCWHLITFLTWKPYMARQWRLLIEDVHHTRTLSVPAFNTTAFMTRGFVETFFSVVDEPNTVTITDPSKAGKPVTELIRGRSHHINLSGFPPLALVSFWLRGGPSNHTVVISDDSVLIEALLPCSSDGSTSFDWPVPNSLSPVTSGGMWKCKMCWGISWLWALRWLLIEGNE